MVSGIALALRPTVRAPSNSYAPDALATPSATSPRGKWQTKRLTHRPAIDEPKPRSLWTRMRIHIYIYICTYSLLVYAFILHDYKYQHRYDMNTDIDFLAGSLMTASATPSSSNKCHGRFPQSWMWCTPCGSQLVTALRPHGMRCIYIYIHVFVCVCCSSACVCIPVFYMCMYVCMYVYNACRYVGMQYVGMCVCMHVRIRTY